jgi:hypothetical protein
MTFGIAWGVMEAVMKRTGPEPPTKVSSESNVSMMPGARPRGLSLRRNQEGQEQEKAESKDPAPPSSSRLGARVAPQRCPILPAGTNNVAQEKSKMLEKGVDADN